MRKLNVKLLLILLGVATSAGLGIWLVHYLQTGRIAQALLWQAQRAESEGQTQQAIKYLGRYLEFNPDDLDERAHLGQILAGDAAQAANYRSRERAFFVLDQVVARDPSRTDLRRLLARVALQLRPPRLDDARNHLQALAKEAPDDGEVLQMLGQVCQAKEELTEAEAWYAKAVERTPDQVPTYVRLANLKRYRLAPNKNQVTPVPEADQVIDQMVTRNPNAFQAYLARWAFLREQGQGEKTGPDIARALQLAPDEPGVLLAAGEVALEGRDAPAARKYYSRGLELFPADARMYEGLAGAELIDKKRGEAVHVLRRGVNALKGPARLELFWHLTNLQIDENQIDGAEATLQEMKAANASSASTNYLQARLLMRRGEWAEAATTFENTRPMLEDSPDLCRQVDLFLGQCYARLNDANRQLAAYSRVLESQPNSMPARLGLAAAQSALNRHEDALTHYRQVLTRADAPPTAWLEFGRLLTLRCLQRGGDADGWAEVEEVLTKAAEKMPESVEPILLRAEIQVARRQLDEAEKTITEARAKYPDRVPLMTALADLALVRGNPEQALKLLTEAEQKAGDTVEIRLAKARYWAAGKTDRMADELAKLTQGMDKLSPDDRTRLLGGLAEVNFRRGDLAEATRLWRLLTHEPRHASDLRLRQLLFDLALRQKDEAGMDQVLAEVKEIEGPDGYLWKYGEAVRQIWRVREKRATIDVLDDVRTQLDRVAAQRPSWSPVLLAKADLEALRGNTEQAIANYRQVLDLGERSSRVVRPLVHLLYQRQRFAEADEEIRRLQKHAAIAPDLQRMAADISLRNQDPARAVELALEAVPGDSTDYRDYLWLGQMLAASGNQPREAESRLRKAVEMKSGAPETWVALVQFLASTGRTQDAEEAIAQAQKNLPDETEPLALAQCYEALRQPEQAARYYQEAVKARPRDVLVIRGAAAFALRNGRLKEAEPLLRVLYERRIPASESDVAWARRNLALVLAGGEVGQFREALSLVGMNLDTAGLPQEGSPVSRDEPIEEARARARVLAMRPAPVYRNRAVAIFEDLNRRQSLTPGDVLLLAQLYQAQSAWPRAAESLRTLVSAMPREPLYTIQYTQALIRQGKVKEAQPYLQKLEAMEQERKLEAGSLATVELRVMAYDVTNQVDEAVALLEKHVHRPGARPEEIVQLISYLGRHKRTSEALQRCEAAWKTCRPEVVGAAAVGVLRAGKPTEDQLTKVEGWLADAVGKNAKSTSLKVQLADLKDMRGHFSDAEKLYREVVVQEPDNIVALNNLAWLLAQRPEPDRDALKLITRAIDLMGPRPELLDTRGMVYLSLNNSDRAIADLTQVTEATPSGPRFFRLARAHQLAQNEFEARRAFRKSKELGMSLDQLHPAERVAAGPVFRELDRR